MNTTFLSFHFTVLFFNMIKLDTSSQNRKLIQPLAIGSIQLNKLFNFIIIPIGGASGNQLS